MTRAGEAFRRDGWRVGHLSPTRDLTAVAALMLACADYTLLVTGEPPTPDEATEFFDAVPPECASDAMLKLGVWRQDATDGPLLGLVDICRGYPAPEVWYVGLLLLHPDARGQGAGRAVTAGLVDLAKAAGAARLALSVVEENQAGLRFWQAVGFVPVRHLPPRCFGAKEQARIELARSL